MSRLVFVLLLFCPLLMSFSSFPQLPLDLSPLATPIIRSKPEGAADSEAHRVSPLPHPESTTSDDKVWAFFKKKKKQKHLLTNHKSFCFFRLEKLEQRCTKDDQSHNWLIDFLSNHFLFYYQWSVTCQRLIVGHMVVIKHFCS